MKNNIIKNNIEKNIRIANNRYIIALIVLVEILISVTSMAQFILPNSPPTNPEVLYPSPATSSDYLGSNTSFLSNYSSDNATWSPSLNKGISVIGWSYDATSGGGGKIAIGTHGLSGPSMPFVGEYILDVDYAIDLRVGVMGDYIVASYYDLQYNQYMFSWWYWAGPGVPPSSINSFVLPITSPSTGYERISMDINLDGDKAAIVYSNLGTIWGMGVRLGGSPFNFSVYANELSTIAGSPTDNINPDISFNRQFTPGSYVDYIYYTYYNTVSGQEYVYRLTFDDLDFRTAVGFASLDAYSLPTGVNYVNFDCPDFYSLNHWAYTYPYFSSGGRIFVRSDAGSGAYTTNINDGGCSPLPSLINSYTSSTNPDLAYNLNPGRDEIVVAWTSNSPGDYLLSRAYTTSYISATVALNGVGSPKSVMGSDYAIIEDSFDVYPTNLIAINRRVQCANRLVSFCTDNLGYALKHKNIESFVPFYYRKSQNTNLDMTEENLKVYPNPFTDKINLQIPTSLQKGTWNIIITDLLGKQIASYDGDYPNQFIQESSKKLTKGIYIIKIQSAIINPQIIKIIKQ